MAQVQYSVTNFPRQGDYFVNHPEIVQESLGDFNLTDGTVKFVILGEPAVGKTCLTARICYDKFSNSYEATIGVQFSPSSVTINGKKAKLFFWDIAGQQRYTEVTTHYFRGADVAFLCFDLSNANATLPKLKNWLQTLLNNTQPPSAMFLVGCKSDLQADIGDATIENFAQENNLEYFKTSSKDSLNVKELIERAAYVACVEKQKTAKKKQMQRKTIEETANSGSNNAGGNANGSGNENGAVDLAKPSSSKGKKKCC